MWQQTYDPLNSPVLSALVAAVPIILFLLGLTVLKLSGLKSALLTLVTTLIIGCAIFGLPITAGAGSILSGFLSGAWPIGWIVLMAVWLYRIAVRAGNFDIVRSSVSSISNDQRIQVLLIAFCFGGFIEGAAGFGIPIAISAALLVSLGFNPLKASMLALVANAASGAYGAIGIPVTTAAKVGGLDTAHLSAGMVPVLQIFVAFVPLLMVAIQDGMRGIREVGLVALMTGIIFSGGQAAILMLLGSPELVDIIPPLLSLVALALVMQKWQPKHIYREPTAPSLEEAQAQQNVKHTGGEIVKAWSPFIFLSATILLWSTALKPVFATTGPLGAATLAFPIPGIHEAITTGTGKTVTAMFSWNTLGASGTAILVAALITTSIALALAAAGPVFPLLSPIIGWIGVFVTGSVTNANVLFAGLQSTTAAQIAVDPTLLVAANTAGGVMGKIVSPQSIAIAAAAVNSAGEESKITSMSIKYSAILLGLVCVWSFALSLMAG